jgi:hypothetical protein
MMRVYRYVLHRHVAAMLSRGWIATSALDGTHHGRHAVLMRACECNPEGGA